MKSRVMNRKGCVLPFGTSSGSRTSFLQVARHRARLERGQTLHRIATAIVRRGPERDEANRGHLGEA
jgi:hypothetical protein